MTTGQRRILVIDDGAEIRGIFELNVSARGFAVRGAADGLAGLALFRDWEPELIILDVVMPKVDGFALLPTIRRLIEAPVIMLTARRTLSDKVKGPEGGADDYLAKPCEVAELISRSNKGLRQPQIDHRQTLTDSDLSVDLQTRLVTRGQSRIELSAREFSVLVTMLRQPGEVFSREQLFDAVWVSECDAEVGMSTERCRTSAQRSVGTSKKRLSRRDRDVAFRCESSDG